MKSQKDMGCEVTLAWPWLCHLPRLPLWLSAPLRQTAIGPLSTWGKLKLGMVDPLGGGDRRARSIPSASQASSDNVASLWVSDAPTFL